MISPLKNIIWLTLLTAAPAIGHADSSGSFRVFSWNISDDSFVDAPEEFAAVLGGTAADVFLLDEVEPSATSEELRKVLATISGEESEWNIDYGVSGGPQRVVIATRLPVEDVEEFNDLIPYPESDRNHIFRQMTQPQRDNPATTMRGGIPVNGAIVTVRNKRLLIVGVDLMCCGNHPAAWPEYRRRAEAREVRKTVQRVLHRTNVDGIIIAGDFNIVETPLPLSLASGPYSAPHNALISAEAYHQDGVAAWTWFGEGTPFASRPLDFQLYSPGSMLVTKALVHDVGAELSEHRPIVVDYRWKVD